MKNFVGTIHLSFLLILRVLLKKKYISPKNFAPYAFLLLRKKKKNTQNSLNNYIFLLKRKKISEMNSENEIELFFKKKNRLKLSMNKKRSLKMKLYGLNLFHFLKDFLIQKRKEYCE